MTVSCHPWHPKRINLLPLAGRFSTAVELMIANSNERISTSASEASAQVLSIAWRRGAAASPLQPHARTVGAHLSTKARPKVHVAKPSAQESR